MRGSPLGIATELGGTARLPSSFHSLYALKPSTGRLSARNIAGVNHSIPICRTTPSFLSADLATLQDLTRLTFGASEYRTDPEWLDVPWRGTRIQRLSMSNQHPTFAVLTCNRFVQPQPPVRRALKMVVKALEGYGYRVVQWDPPPHPPAIQNFFNMVLADGGSEVRAQIKASGEPPVPQLQAWIAKSEDESPISVKEY